MLRLRARDGRNPRDLAALNLAKCLKERSGQIRYVRTMFDVIAPGYDIFTKLFSFGMDRQWKERLIHEAGRRTLPGAFILDLACGTGDLGIGLEKQTEARLMLGLDLSPEMLRLAKSRAAEAKSRLRVAAGDILAVCVPDSCVDVVTIGYGLRNTSDLPAALTEVFRVLKPGGILANLDFHRPVSAAWRKLFLWYMWNAGRLAGWLWHREPATYGYLAPSIRRYLSIPEFEAELACAGFTVEWRSQRLGGAIGIHIARKARSANSPAAVERGPFA